jgi:hypothetical protein
LADDQTQWFSSEDKQNGGKELERETIFSNEKTFYRLSENHKSKSEK